MMGLPFVLCACLVAPPPPGVQAVAPTVEDQAPRPRLLVDVAVATGGSLAVAFGKPDIRRALLDDARASNVRENFLHPVRQVRAGTRRDSDPFWVNYVAHPGLFALEGLYLKRRGYANGTAFLFTQVHSVLWEFAVEGSAFEPSGKDLLSDAGGAALAIWVLRPVASRASRRLEEGRGRIWDHALRLLDPVEAVAPSTGPGARDVLLTPMLSPNAVGVCLTARF